MADYSPHPGPGTGDLGVRAGGRTSPPAPAFQRLPFEKQEAGKLGYLLFYFLIFLFKRLGGEGRELDRLSVFFFYTPRPQRQLFENSIPERTTKQEREKEKIKNILSVGEEEERGWRRKEVSPALPAPAGGAPRG